MPQYIIGIDEAGYGPNLGPLVICATLWKVAENFRVEQFWEILAPDVTQHKPDHDRQIQVADSKVVYSSTSGLNNLEKAVLCLWLAMLKKHGLHTGYTEFKKSLTGVDSDPSHMCNQIAGLLLPVETNLDCVEQCNTLIQHHYSNKNIVTICVQAKVVQPREFNQLLVKYGNKGQLLSQLSLQLISSMINQHLASHNKLEISIFADKQGGRKSYAGLIAEYFPQEIPRVLQEEQTVSRYELGAMNWQFSVGSERYFPVAVASMFAKYLRELEMMIFNQYWRQHFPEIKPTAGYPVDAKRFFKLIEPELSRLSLNKTELWRNK